MNFRDNSTPNGIVSQAFGVEVIVIADTVGQGADQECREVVIWPDSQVSVKLGESVVAAAAGTTLNSEYLVLPISNTNKLYFSGTNTNRVNILWRS